MIYIFSGCQSVCSLPGYFCSACGDACKQCGPACKACSGAFKGCGDEVKHFMERPLSVYVVASIILSAVTLYLGYNDMSKKPSCTSNYLYILMGFAVINIIFAIYVQCKTWRTIMSEEERFIDGDDPQVTLSSQGGHAAAGAAAGLLGQAAGRAGGFGGGVGAALGKAQQAAAKSKPAEEKFAPNPGKVIVPTEVVQESFKKVFMEDLVVLAMFFGLVGVFIMSFIEPKTIDGVTCGVSDASRKCAEMYFVLAGVWSCMYMKCSCCANKVSVTKEEMANKFPEKYGHLDENANNVAE